MLKISTKILLISTAFGTAFSASGCSANSNENGSPTEVSAEKTAATSLNLKKGQVLSITIPQSKKGGDDARKAYYASAFPIAGKFGLKREAALKITNTIISEYKPNGVIFYSWPSEAAETKLSQHPDWPAIKAKRPAAWEELKIYNDVLEEDLNINFDPTKSYTLVIAWGNPKNPKDYAQYLENIEDDLNASGGRFVYMMKNPRLESHDPSSIAPIQLTFVEWDTLDGFTKLRGLDSYKADTKLIASGTTHVEFYRLGTITQK